MEDLILYVQQHAEMAPWLIFGLLLLAGLNIPVSEDGMLFVSALIATERPDLMVNLFLGVFLGAYFSDVICYTLGRTMGPRLWEMKWFARMVSRDKVDKVTSFYERYGVLTLIFGRFIPFGVRNALFLTAGLGKMNFRRFALSDLLAASISCSFYFWLYLTYGKAVIAVVQRGNMVLFGAAAGFGIFFFIRGRMKRKSSLSEDAGDLSPKRED
jgi:membrane-associated protein